MSTSTPQTLKGFRDFLPAEKRVRDQVARLIVETFENFGFQPLETPTLEYASLLLGKYGDEADRLVYTFTDKGDRQVGLRYDQTVPTARVLTQYRDQLPKFFRRYQMQNVFRADKPQKGRYREFAQCDIDIFNAPAPVADAEIIACAYQAFKNIGFSQVEIRINDRQILMSTLGQFATEQVPVMSVIQSIDKLDKMPAEAVIKELVSKGLEQTQAESALANIQQQQPSPELQSIIEACQALGVEAQDIKFSPTLARGLDYYTGMIFEVWLPAYSAGSCGGGGRFDNLIHQLGGPNIPAVGVAFGFDRVVEAAVQLGLVTNSQVQAKVLVSLFSPETQTASLELATQLRSNGIATEVYPKFDNLGKQIGYANQIGAQYVVVIGDEEIANHTITIKNLQTTEQKTVGVEKLLSTLSSCPDKVGA